MYVCMVGGVGECACCFSVVRCFLSLLDWSVWHCASPRRVHRSDSHPNGDSTGVTSVWQPLDTRTYTDVNTVCGRCARRGAVCVCGAYRLVSCSSSQCGAVRSITLCAPHHHHRVEHTYATNTHTNNQLESLQSLNSHNTHVFVQLAHRSSSSTIDPSPSNRWHHRCCL